MKNLFCKALLLCAASLFGLTSCEESGQEVDIIIPVESVTVGVDGGSFSDLFPAYDAVYFNIGDGGETALAAVVPIQLVATVSPSDATVSTVSWLCDDTTVATVSSDGLVTPKGGGTAQVFVVAGSQQTGTVQSVVRVIVDKDPNSDNGDLSLSEEEITLYINNGVCDEYQLTADLSRNVTSYTIDDVKWRSGNTSVATVDDTGMVTAVARAVAPVTITAYIEDVDGEVVISTTCSVYVYTTVYEISIDAAAQTETRLISVAEGDPDGKDILYGEVEAGSVITATPYVGLVAELRSGGDDFMFSATLAHSQAYDNTVTWTSSNWSVATVDSSTGVVEVVGPGYAVITASANGIYPEGDAVTATSLIYVDEQEPVALNSVYISADLAGLVALTSKASDGTPYAMVGTGKLLRLYANIDPVNATDIIETWSVSSNNEKYKSSFDDENDGLIEGGTLVDGDVHADITVALSASAGGATASNTGYVRVIREAEELKITNDVTTMPISANMTFTADLYADLGSGSQIVTDGQIYDTSITWSVEEGSEHAFVETSSGTLMVKNTATVGGLVTVRATANNGSWETDNQDPVYDEFSFTVVQSLVAIESTSITTDSDQCVDEDGEASTTVVTFYDDANTVELEANFSDDNKRTLTLRAAYSGTNDNDPTNTVTAWKIYDVSGATDTEIDESTIKNNDSHGLVTLNIGKNLGTFKLKATSTSNGLFDKNFFDENTYQEDEVTITISEILVREVTVTSDTGATGMSQDASLTLTATLLPKYATDQSVDWSSTGGYELPSTAEGTVETSVNGLSYTITATSTGGYVDVVATALNSDDVDVASDAFRVDIGTYPDVVTIETLSYPTSEKIYVGQSMTLTASTTYESNSTDIIQTVIWSSSNEAVATVDPATGVVTAKGKGTVNITATSAGNAPSAVTPASNTVAIKVSGYEISSVQFSESTYSAAVGVEIDLGALVSSSFSADYTGYQSSVTGAYDEAVTYSFTSSGDSVFNLSGNTDGKMTALMSSNSAVTITVTATGVDSGSQKSADIDVTVYNTISSVEIGVYSGSIEDGGTFYWINGGVNIFTLSSTSTFASGDGGGADEITSTTWTSSNENYVTFGVNDVVSVLGATNEEIIITRSVTGKTSGITVTDTFSFSINAAIESVSLSTTTLSLYDDATSGTNTGTVTIKTEPYDTGKADSAVWTLSGATISYTDSEGTVYTGVAIAYEDISSYLTLRSSGVNGSTVTIKSLDPNELGYTNVTIEANLSVLVMYNTTSAETLNCKVYVYGNVSTTPGFDLGGDL